MSKKQPVMINIQECIKVTPDDVFESKVVPSGNGAVIPAYKKYIGKECIVIMKSKKSKTKQHQEVADYLDNAAEMDLAKKA